MSKSTKINLSKSKQRNRTLIDSQIDQNNKARDLCELCNIPVILMAQNSNQLIQDSTLLANLLNT